MAGNAVVTKVDSHGAAMGGQLPPEAAQHLSDRLRHQATKEADEFLKDFREAAREGDFGVAPWSLDVSVDVPFHQGQALYEVGQKVTVCVPQSAAMWLAG